MMLQESTDKFVDPDPLFIIAVACCTEVIYFVMMEFAEKELKKYVPNGIN